jgi:hypothetical protein
VFDRVESQKGLVKGYIPLKISCLQITVRTVRTVGTDQTVSTDQTVDSKEEKSGKPAPTAA